MPKNAQFASEATAKKDPMRERLGRALGTKKISLKRASESAGLGPSFAHEFIKYGRGGSHQALEKLCQANGISWEWLKTGAGEITGLPRAGQFKPVSQEALEVAILFAVQTIFPSSQESTVRGLALLLIGSARVPPGSILDENMKSRMRSQIEGAIRLILLQSNQGYAK